ncbi:MAG: DNA (cytosine-5-)-methyltransferase [Pelagibacterales bacterium]|nr:DNA (cytosine-5-)-methyltransferase [Pelagibacterales bacterium]
MKVLSLFDGIAGARQALKNLNIDCEYYASEIDKFAIQVAKNNHSDIIHIGDVNTIHFGEFANDIDLLVAGFPCQDLSIAKRDGKGLDGARSGLFYKCLEALEIIKPKYFLFENVASMKKEWKDKISELLGVEPVMINSALVTAQQRKRLYWVGKLQQNGTYKKVEIEQPQDKGVLLKDIIESGDTEKLKSYCITATYSRACPEDYFNHGQRQLVFEPIKIGDIGKNNQSSRVYSIQGKSVCLNAGGGGGGAKTGLYKIDLPNGQYTVRKLTPTECARLQGFPNNYHDVISNTQAYKCYGNSFTVPVIEHILKNI